MPKTHLMLEMDMSWQQQNAAGGALKVGLAPVYCPYKLIFLRAEDSGTNGLTAGIRNSNSGQNLILWGNVSSIASGILQMAQNGTPAVSTPNPYAAGSYDIPIGGEAQVFVDQTAAGAQNDTLRVKALIELFPKDPVSMDIGLPTWDDSRSSNHANVVQTQNYWNYWTWTEPDG